MVTIALSLTPASRSSGALAMGTIYISRWLAGSSATPALVLGETIPASTGRPAAVPESAQGLFADPRRGRLPATLLLLPVGIADLNHCAAWSVSLGS
jgi:hypothetical protein